MTACFRWLMYDKEKDVRIKACADNASRAAFYKYKLEEEVCNC